MKNRLLNLIQSRKRYHLLLTLVLLPTVLLFVTFFAFKVQASFGTWGNTSLIHACVGFRGVVFLVAPSDSCDASETQVTWLKDVNAGTGLTITRNSSGATLSLANTDGWLATDESWTYASSTTITVPSDATAKYSIGDKVRLKQGGGYKYFYIINVASTMLTITGGSDYTLTNASITDNDVSKVSTQVGFPQWFSYTPSYTGFSSNPTGGVNRFKISENTVTVMRRTGTAGTSNGVTFLITAPVTSANTTTDFWTGGMAFVSDNSSNQGSPGRVYVQANTNTITLEKAFNSNAWTPSGTKDAEYIFQYEIN